MESRTLQIFHEEIRNDFHFCFTAGGPTAPILCSSFFSEFFFLSSISQQRFAVLHIKSLGETTKPKSAIFIKCTETKKFVLHLWVKISCSQCPDKIKLFTKKQKIKKSTLTYVIMTGAERLWNVWNIMTGKLIPTCLFGSHVLNRDTSRQGWMIHVYNWKTTVLHILEI